MLFRCVAPVLLLAVGAMAQAEESPLVAYSLDPGLPPIASSDYAARNLKRIAYELERNPPPPREECAQTLGASRFASTYEDLATLRETQGDYDAAEDALRAALACTPRDAWIYANLGALHLSRGRMREAREIVERGRAVDPDDRSLLGVLARIDFVEERWADATARLRVIATTEPDNGRAAFYQLFLWLAQRRAGVTEPELVSRDVFDEWPAPILDTLKGNLSEAELVEIIRTDQADAPRHALTEALYYVGELRLAEGQTEVARRHFAATVNLKVRDYIEYGMAHAELARLREAGEEGER